MNLREVCDSLSNATLLLTRTSNCIVSLYTLECIRDLNRYHFELEFTGIVAPLHEIFKGIWHINTFPIQLKACYLRFIQLIWELTLVVNASTIEWQNHKNYLCFRLFNFIGNFKFEIEKEINQIENQ